MAGPVPAIPIIQALCPPDRDRRDEPGDDESAANPLAALRPSATARLRMACSTETIVINTPADWTCSGESSIAAAFRGGSGVEPDRSAKAAPPTARVIAAPTATLAPKSFGFGSGDGGAQRSRQRLPRRISRCHRNEMIDISIRGRDNAFRVLPKHCSVRIGCLPSSMGLQALKEVT